MEDIPLTTEPELEGTVSEVGALMFTSTLPPAPGEAAEEGGAPKEAPPMAGACHGRGATKAHCGGPAALRRPQPHLVQRDCCLGRVALWRRALQAHRHCRDEQQWGCQMVNSWGRYWKWSWVVSGEGMRRGREK